RLNYLRRRMEAKELRREFLSFVNACHAKTMRASSTCRVALVEDKSSGTGLIQEVKAQSPIPVQAVQRHIDKFTRAMDVAHHHAAKKVVLPLHDEHNYEMVSEVAAFTHDDSHKFDDQTDVMIDALDYAFVRPVAKK